MNPTYILLLAVFALGAAGCDAAPDQLSEFVATNEPTLVFSPGYTINVDGQVVPIAGFDACPRADSTMVKLFGPTPDEGQHCIVLSKDRATVTVQLGLPSGAKTEEWTIVRESGRLDGGRPYNRTRLRRPDGSMVIPASLS